MGTSVSNECIGRQWLLVKVFLSAGSSFFTFWPMGFFSGANPPTHALWISKILVALSFTSGTELYLCAVFFLVAQVD
jgi:hypothetical protein